MLSGICVARETAVLLVWAAEASVLDALRSTGRPSELSESESVGAQESEATIGTYVVVRLS